MLIKDEFKHGQVVFLKTDPDQSKRIVTAIHVYKAGELTYTLNCGTTTSDHYGFEISKEKDLAMA